MSQIPKSKEEIYDDWKLGERPHIKSAVLKAMQQCADQQTSLSSEEVKGQIASMRKLWTDQLTSNLELNTELNDLNRRIVEGKKENDRLVGLIEKAFIAGEKRKTWIYHGNGQPPMPPDLQQFKTENKL